MTSWNPALPADSSKIRLSAGYLRNNELAVQLVLTSGNLTNGYPYIPNTTPMFMYANTAPSGWTLYSSVSDCLLAVKGGASQYNATGGAGVTVGTWNGPAIALTQAQLPSPLTSVTGYDNSNGGNNFSASQFVGNSFSISIPNAGGGQTHQHDWTSTRPQAALGILCTKNT